MGKYHKNIRLHRNVYETSGAICSITLCTEGKTPYFQNRELTTACITQIKSDANVCSASVYAYCFMPDHLHLVISPGNKKDLISFVGEYKGRTTRIAWSFGIKGKLWQASFYDHFLRKEEILKDVVMYVLNNPVRKGFVSEWQEYPYSGSLEFEFQE